MAQDFVIGGVNNFSYIKPPAFNISQFRTSFSKSGEPANPTNYLVSLTRLPKKALVSMGKPIMDDVEFDFRFRCEAVSIPETSLRTIDRKTYGPIQKVVTGKDYQVANISIIVSENGEERYFFYKWHEIIANLSSTNNVAYYNDYVGTINITQFGKSAHTSGSNKDEAKQTYMFYLIEAYPISIQEVPLSWNMNNDYIRQNITIQYKKVIETKINTFDPPEEKNQKNSIWINIKNII